MTDHTDLRADLEAAQARIKELEGAGWQPIETAPHGVDVLLYCPERGITNHERIELGTASSGWRTDRASTMSWHSWATHWMPLPDLPALTSTGD